MQRKLACQDLYKALIKNDVQYFCGVPDSLTGSFSFFLEDNASEFHTITANEGNAIGLAIGYHAATAKTPLVYMQNSGLGNALDPLVSLADPTVFGVPMILLVGWRGKPGINDEPQHAKQGAITRELLITLGISSDVLSNNTDIMNNQVKKAASDASKDGRPYALLVEKDVIDDYEFTSESSNDYALTREEAITLIVDNLSSQDVVIAGIGKTSRELFEYRETMQKLHDSDFLIVGGMGHASSIALGVAEEKPQRNIYCLDGDGSILMHMGSLATIGNKSPKNFYHILFNNGVHDSVGGHPTTGPNIDIPAVARACNYTETYSVKDVEELKKAITRTKNTEGPVLIEVEIRSGARLGLTRPTISPRQNKRLFTNFLAN